MVNYVISKNIWKFKHHVRVQKGAVNPCKQFYYNKKPNQLMILFPYVFTWYYVSI